MGCNGFDGTTEINGLRSGGETIIYMTNLNNVANASTVNIDGIWKHEGGFLPFTSVKVVQNGTNRNQYFVYAYVQTYTQHVINAETSGGTIWTTSFTPTTDPGANSSTVQLLQCTYAAIGPNIGIGITNPTSRLHVNGVITTTANPFPTRDPASYLLSMNINSGIINTTPLTFTYNFSNGSAQNGGAVSLPISNYITSGIYIIRMYGGGGSIGRYAAIVSFLEGYSFQIITTLMNIVIDGYSTMFTVNASGSPGNVVGTLQWNYTLLPPGTWTVAVIITPLFPM